MNEEIFLEVDNKSFFESTYGKNSFKATSGALGQELINIFSNKRTVLENLGNSIHEDLFLFKDGVACKKSIYINETSNLILWDRIWNMHSDEGVTVYLRGLQKYMPQVDNILNNFGRMFKNRTPFANIFITPPQSTGLNAHFDPTEFFVLQVSGSKVWNYWGTVIPEIADKMYPKEMADYCESVTHNTNTERIFELHTGDLLYIPLYGIHAPRTNMLSSCHITLGLAHPYLRGIKPT